MEGFFKNVEAVNNIVNGLVWGVPMLVLLIGAGLFLTIRLKGMQFRKFGYAMKNTIGKVFHKQKADDGSVTPFQALTTALAATVGTGNVAGITTAITLGGPGAIFWLWVSALVGMATKYSEVVLAIRYRERNEKGDWVGGPMYYIKNGLGKNWHWLAGLFCIFGALAAFGIGNAVQVGTITSSINTAILSFFPQAADSTMIINIVIGVVLALIIGAVLMGGIKRIGTVTEKLVPFMAVLYIIACLAVIFTNAEKLGQVFGMIFEGAFSPQGVVGAGAGIGVKSCITWGVKRGVFSNEAGLGSAPIAHAATSESNAVRQGLYGIFEVFMDTIVICTLTGVTLLISGIDFTYGVEGATSLNAAAFGTIFGDKTGALIIAIGLSLFALSTVLSWGLYGSRCIEALFGGKAIRPYQLVFVIITVIGATMEIGLAWAIADTLNGLMALPNLVGLIGLSGVVASLTKEHFEKKKQTSLKEQ